MSGGRASMATHSRGFRAHPSAASAAVLLPLGPTFPNPRSLGRPGLGVQEPQLTIRRGSALVAQRRPGHWELPQEPWMVSPWQEAAGGRAGTGIFPLATATAMGTLDQAQARPVPRRGLAGVGHTKAIFPDRFWSQES